MSTAPYSPSAGSRALSLAARLLEALPRNRALISLGLLVGALFAFETFNYGTTEFALTDVLGDLSFGGMRWATILAFAFCAIDFAGIARLFTPERGADEPVEVWYLLAAWLLAAAMNAVLTWWAVSLALLEHQSLGNAILGQEALLRTVPVFVAVLVWLIRVLIIGTLTFAGERMLATAERPRPVRVPSTRSTPGGVRRPSTNGTGIPRPVRPAPKPVPRREPQYIPDPISAAPPEHH